MQDRSNPSPAGQLSDSGSSWELAAESITVRIRWFGLAIGLVVVNFLGKTSNQTILNSILLLGAIYALLDTWWSLRGKMFLGRWPLVISLMEAIFIGLLCFFENGLESPFRFYYFLSILVCANRFSPGIAYSTLAMHSLSFLALSLYHPEILWTTPNISTVVLMLVLMGWVTWASTSLAALVKRASEWLTKLNEELKDNQTQLEERIQTRTRELQESQAMLVQQEKQAAFGLLAAGIAHEVGNPLAAISSLVQMLNRRHEDEYTRERLHMVDDQLRRIQRILSELVDFSRPATKEKALCDIHEVIDAALNIAKYYKGKKGKKILTTYAENLPRLKVARDQLVQVFLNLILNAMDATREGGCIEIRTCEQFGRIRVAVRDDGHGIAPEAQEQIFKPYFTTKPTGTGLGLFVCRNIILQMSGEIFLRESTPGGTEFVVCLGDESLTRENRLPISTSPALNGGLLL